jgi:hypothetical protein
MNPHLKELAGNLLTAFRSDLDEADQRRIGWRRFQPLHGLTCEALSDPLELVSGRMEAVVDELRAEIDRPQIEFQTACQAR